MSPQPVDPTTFLPLSNLSFHVLLALGAGPSHGYAIGKEIEHRSAGKLNPTTGALYQALKRMTESGLIEKAERANAQSMDARRQHFRLTPLGKKVVASEAERLHSLVKEASDRKLYSGPA